MTRKIDDLEKYFLEQGYIDEKPILSQEELIPLALATPPAARLSPEITSECLHRWWALSSHANEFE